MSNISSKLISEKICDVIRCQDGKLDWHEIAAAVGATHLQNAAISLLNSECSSAVESFVVSMAKGTRDIGSCDREIVTSSWSLFLL